MMTWQCKRQGLAEACSASTDQPCIAILHCKQCLMLRAQSNLKCHQIGAALSSQPSHILNQPLLPAPLHGTQRQNAVALRCISQHHRPAESHLIWSYVHDSVLLQSPHSMLRTLMQSGGCTKLHCAMFRAHLSHISRAIPMFFPRRKGCVAADCNAERNLHARLHFVHPHPHVVHASSCTTLPERLPFLAFHIQSCQFTYICEGKGCIAADCDARRNTHARPHAGQPCVQPSGISTRHAPPAPLRAPHPGPEQAGAAELWRLRFCPADPWGYATHGADTPHPLPAANPQRWPSWCPQ